MELYGWLHLNKQGETVLGGMTANNYHSYIAEHDMDYNTIK